MIIWKGWGILTVLFAVIGIVVGSMIGAVAGALAGGLLGGVIAGVLNYLVAKAVTSSTVVIDPATGQQILLQKSSSLFFIPINGSLRFLWWQGFSSGSWPCRRKRARSKLTRNFPEKRFLRRRMI